MLVTLTERKNMFFSIRVARDFFLSLCWSTYIFRYEEMFDNYLGDMTQDPCQQPHATPHLFQQQILHTHTHRFESNQQGHVEESSK